jgi:hypothetical protein
MVSRIAAEVLLDLRFGVQSDVHYWWGGEIEAREPPPRKRPVFLRFKAIAPGRTRMTVDFPRYDRRFGEDLLNRITARVGEEIGRLPPVVRASLEGRYDGTLAWCLAAAEEALRQLDRTVAERVVRSTWARLEARGTDEAAFEVTIVVLDSGAVRVVFESGAEDKGTADQRAERLKAEFERALLRLR